MRYFLILAFLLSGCATTQSGEIRIVWHKIESESFLFEKKRGQDVTHNVTGYFRMVDGVCHVWAPDPPITIKDGKRTFDYGQWGTLGHEVKHCFSGKFHD